MAQGQNPVLQKIDMFDDLKAPNYEKPRENCPTAQLEPSPLNNKLVKIKVFDGSVEKGGFLQQSYLQYKVTTEAEGVSWSISRKDADFYFLRKVLLKNYPYMMVPPLPAKKKKDSEKSIKRRQNYLSRFMQGIARCEEFKSDKFLLQWL